MNGNQKNIAAQDKKPVPIARQEEFPESVTATFDLNEMGQISRRRFLALAGASAAVVATACTDYQDKGNIVPYNKKPDEIIPGRSNYYASTCTACSLGCGILIKTREGRPVKVDGNPEHPVNKGKICSIGQANIQNLYDPERYKEPQKKINGKFFKISWHDADREIIAELDKAKISNKDIAIITHRINSPSQWRVLEDFKKKYPNTKVYSYELFDDSNKISTWSKSYIQNGFKYIPFVKLDEAEIILSLESDFLGTDGNFVENIRLFTDRRNADDLNRFSRLYAAEAGMSITGMNADYRLRIKPEEQFDFVMSLIAEIKPKTAFQLLPENQDLINQYSLRKFSEEYGIGYELLKQIADDLLNSQGKSIVIAGSTLPENIQSAVNLLNEELSNHKLYDFESGSTYFTDLSAYSDFSQLIEKLNRGEVGAVIQFDTNPVYHLPKNTGYETAVKKAGCVITMTESETESSFISNYILPVNHNFESWGDYLMRAGVAGLQQPVIAPLYNTRQKEAVLLTWLGGSGYEEKIFYNYLKNFWEREYYPKLNIAADFQSFWNAFLHDGVFVFKIPVPLNKTFTQIPLQKDLTKIDVKNITLLLTKSYNIGCGKYAANGWLQELPHPVTKVTWDNYASVSLKTANNLGVKSNERLEIKHNGTTLILPVYIQPGMADNVVCVELGYGRTKAGTIGTGVGTNANVFLGVDKYSPWIITNVSVKKAPGTYKLASTQEHHKIDEPESAELHKTRNIIREGTVAVYKKNPGFIKHEQKSHDLTITPHVKFEGVKWAMSIDMNKCIGCNACVAACNVENNVPVVGREQILKGREMHWLRIDRYYSGPVENPEVSSQPILCQHCDNAPCENVCPVVATNHSPDGLNQMVYNRCVGTRYCANNCPFKVRRFNFYNFRDHFADGFYTGDSLKLAANPEVTVRSRGVMEKCTFCHQRIMEARQEEIATAEPGRSEKVTTACQDACPSSAITFGNSNNKKSDIAKSREHNLGYGILEELNIKPNITYIARLRNKKPEAKS